MPSLSDAAGKVFTRGERLNGTQAAAIEKSVGNLARDVQQFAGDAEILDGLLERAAMIVDFNGGRAPETLKGTLRGLAQKIDGRECRAVVLKRSMGGDSAASIVQANIGAKPNGPQP